MANIRLLRTYTTTASVSPKIRLRSTYTTTSSVAAKARLLRTYTTSQVASAKIQLLRTYATRQVVVPTVVIAASHSATSPAISGQVVTLSATASGPTGDPIVSYLWTTASPNAPDLSSRTTATTTIRAVPSLEATTYTYRVTAKTSSGVVGTTLVVVPVAASKYFIMDETGVRSPMDFVGINVAKTLVAPPITAKVIRLLRTYTTNLGTADSTTPPPTGTNTTLLLGARVNLPGKGGNATTWFAAGEARWGPLQCAKDYYASNDGPLPRTYTRPFPDHTTILLSFAVGSVLENSTIGFASDPTSNFASFFGSLDPTKTIVTWQHEPERPSQYGATANGGEQFVADFNTFRDKVKRWNPKLPVWAFNSGYQYRQGNPGYDGSYFSGQKADGSGPYSIKSDGHGYDGYRNGTNTGPQGQLVTAVQTRDEFNRWRSFIPAGKPWGVSETGFGRVDNPPNYPEPGLYPTVPQDRITACKSSFDWLLANGASIMLLFFSGDGPDGHNWYPNDSETDFDAMFNALPRKQ